MTTRRQVLAGAAASAAAVFAGSRTPAVGQAAPRSAATWDSGQLQHLLPTASHDRFLIKASFTSPLDSAPSLFIGARRVPGRRTDLEGSTWSFDA